MESITYLIFIYAGILLLNTLVAITLWKKNDVKDFLYLVYYWLGVFITFLIQGLAGTNYLAITISAAFLTIPMFLVAKVIPWGKYEKRELKVYLIAMSGSIALSTIFYFLAMPFWLVCSAPVLLLAYLQFSGSYQLWFKHPSKLSRPYALLLFLSGLHILDFPFLRLNESFLMFGFSLGLFFALSLSVILPSFVIDNHLQAKVDEKTKKLKSLFNVLTHDIASPLMIIGFNLDRYKDQNSPGGLKIEKSYKSILQTLEHVKHMHDIELSSEKLSLSPVDIVRCLSEAVSENEELLDQKGLTVQTHFSEDHMYVMANEFVLKNQIFNNLLTNAIKFSFDGGQIDLNLIAYESNISMEITDHGVGIDKELSARLFKSERNSTQLGTRNEQGSGRGLVILKKYCDLFNVQIKLESSTTSPSFTRISLIFPRAT